MWSGTPTPEPNESLEHWHCFIWGASAGGNLQLVDSLLKDVPVFYNSVVTDVDYGEAEGVVIKTHENVFKGACLAAQAAAGHEDVCLGCCCHC